MNHILFFFINLFCLFCYFFLAGCFMFFLYYFGILKNDTVIRYRFNLLDFILDFIKVLSFDFKHRDPDAFRESGIIIYVGQQGSGKTISMMHDVLMLKHKYKKVKVMGNLAFTGSDQELRSPDDLLLFTNGIHGVITPIDELGVLFYFQLEILKIFRLKCVKLFLKIENLGVYFSELFRKYISWTRIYVAKSL